MAVVVWIVLSTFLAAQVRSSANSWGEYSSSPRRASCVSVCRRPHLFDLIRPSASVLATFSATYSRASSGISCGAAASRSSCVGPFIGSEGLLAFVWGDAWKQWAPVVVVFSSSLKDFLEFLGIARKPACGAACGASEGHSKRAILHAPPTDSVRCRTLGGVERAG